MKTKLVWKMSCYFRRKNDSEFVSFQIGKLTHKKNQDGDTLLRERTTDDVLFLERELHTCYSVYNKEKPSLKPYNELDSTLIGQIRFSAE